MEWAKGGGEQLNHPGARRSNKLLTSKSQDTHTPPPRTPHPQAPTSSHTMQPHTASTTLLLVVLLLVAVAQGFFLAPPPFSRSTRPLTMKASASSSQHPGHGVDRKAALQQGALLSSLFFLASATPALAKDKKEAKGPSFEDSIATLLLSKKVLDPVRKYITIGQYDPARTNIKYVTNQFRIKKAMERAVLLALEQGADEDKAFSAAEVTAVIDNNMSQLDSSVYTQIFIPSEGELNSAAVKYQQQAFEFYDEVLRSIDLVLDLADPPTLASAKKIADGTSLPPFLFKQFNDQFYRPATP